MREREEHGHACVSSLQGRGRRGPGRWEERRSPRWALPPLSPSTPSPEPRPPGLGRGSCAFPSGAGDQQPPLDSLSGARANPKQRGCTCRPSGVWTRPGPRGFWGNGELLLLPVTGSPKASGSLPHPQGARACLLGVGVGAQLLQAPLRPLPAFTPQPLSLPRGHRRRGPKALVPGTAPESCVSVVKWRISRYPRFCPESGEKPLEGVVQALLLIRPRASSSQVNFVVCQLFALLAAIWFRTYLHSSKTSSFIRHVVATLLGLYLAVFCFGW